MLRGKVVAEALAGLPGQGLASMLVSVHPLEGLVSPSRLEPALVETTTGPQGDFSLSVLLAPGEYVVAVRPAEDQPAVTLHRLWISEQESVGADLLLIVPMDPALREKAERQPSRLPAAEDEHERSVEPPKPKLELEPSADAPAEGPKPPPPALVEPTPE